MNQKQGDPHKWREFFHRDEKWDTKTSRKIHIKEAAQILKWLLALDLPKYNILEIGCGNGNIAKIVIDELERRGLDFTYHLTDLVPECLEFTKKRLQNVKDPKKLKFSILDVYQAAKTLGKESQSIIISTGHEAAATYKDAVPEVAKILKKDGVLICDFINHKSISLFLRRFPTFFLRLIKVIPLKSYHFGKTGIKEYFAKHDLQMLGLKNLGLWSMPLLGMFKKL